jgi:hypothetical protein
MRTLFSILATIAWVAVLPWTSAGCGGRAVSGDGDGGAPDALTVEDGALDARLPDGGADPCDTLSLADCRRRADCAADLCYMCSCSPVFEGCRDVSDPPFVCPALGCAQPHCCEQESECQAMGGTCVPPGMPSGCGMCDPDPGDCATDIDCTGGNICEPVLCSCNAALRCTPGCTEPADCAVGTSCTGGDHPRCVPSACSTTTPCPHDFDCDAGTCTRRPCTSDLECDHFCVLGLCYDGQGECEQPMP